MYFFSHVKKNSKNIFLLALFIVFLFSAHIASAAELNLSPSSGSYNVGDTIKLKVVLVSPDQPANFVSDDLSFPKDLLTLTSVSKTDSLISLWPEDPSYSNASGTIDMGGMILDGYTGSSGTILTLSFRVKAVGTADITSVTSSVLADDGQGTNILTSAGGASFVLSPAPTKPISSPVVAPVVPATPKPVNTTTLVKLTTPVFTDYSQNIKEGDFLVVKGFADPLTNIIITSDNSTSSSSNEITHTTATVLSDDSGVFTYVSNRVSQGTYVISAQAQDANGILSDQTSPIEIFVTSLSTPVPTTTKVINIFSVIIPIIALIVLLILLLIWGWYKALHIRESINKKLAHTKALVSKSFDILDEDVEDEVNVFKKIKSLQPLTPTERNLINQLQKDMESAEKTIINDLKDSGK